MMGKQLRLVETGCSCKEKKKRKKNSTFIKESGHRAEHEEKASPQNIEKKKKCVSSVALFRTTLEELPLTQLTIQLENNHMQFHWGTQRPLTPTCFQSRNRNRFESDEGRLPSGPSMEENLADAGQSGMRHTRCPPTVSQSTCCRCHGERKQGGHTVPGCDEHAGTRPSGSIFGGLFPRSIFTVRQAGSSVGVGMRIAWNRSPSAGAGCINSNYTHLLECRANLNPGSL